jgi:hypothetical protein
MSVNVKHLPCDQARPYPDRRRLRNITQPTRPSICPRGRYVYQDGGPCIGPNIQHHTYHRFWVGIPQSMASSGSGAPKRNMTRTNNWVHLAGTGRIFTLPCERSTLLFGSASFVDTQARVLGGGIQPAIQQPRSRVRFHCRPKLFGFFWTSGYFIPKFPACVCFPLLLSI